MATQQKVAWNKDRTESVVLSKLKSFTIKEVTYLLGGTKEVWQLKGWYNDTNSFSFGHFDSMEEAQEFCEKIHKMF